MPRTRSLAWSELKIGIAGIVALALLIVAVVAVGGEGGYFWQRYALRARFDNVQGLKAGAVVRLSGKEIGTVKAVEFADQAIEVRFEVLKDVQALITTTSLAEIGSLSLLGEPIVDIRTPPGGTPLQPDAYVRTTTAKGFADLSAQASAGIDQLNQLITDVRAGHGTLGKIVTDDALYNEMHAFVASAAAVTRSLEAGQGTLGGLAKDPAAYNALKASLEDLQAMTGRINRGEGTLGRLVNDDATGKSLSNTMASAEQISGRLSKGEGTAGKLLTDQQLYDRLNSMASRVDQVVSDLQAGHGTAGQLLHDQQLYENMNKTVVELRALLEAVRQDPRKYLQVRVSIF